MLLYLCTAAAAAALDDGLSRVTGGNLAGSLDDGLLLSPLIARDELASARERSRVTGGNLTGYAGYIASSDDDLDQIFFWLHEARAPVKETCVPLILWLQGGPGVSGQVGSFNEMGPQYVVNGSSPGSSPSSHNRTATWNAKYAMVFIDQPVETGFSFTKTQPKRYTLTSDAAAKALYTVLVQFFKLYREYKCSPFYVMGESYGGHYVPHTSWWIHAMNAVAPASDFINLKGLAIGNPDLDMAAQMPPIADMLYNVGIVDAKEREFTRQLHAEVVALQHTNPVKSFELWNSYWGDCCPCPGCPNGSYTFKTLTGSASRVLLFCRPSRFACRAIERRTALTCTLLSAPTPRTAHCTAPHFPDDDPLDMRTTAMVGSWSLVADFMNSSAVRRALHARPGRAWVEQNNAVYMAMSNSGDAQNASAPLLPLLMAHYDVLLYAGQMDATLGPISLAAAVDKVMTMEGAAQWAPAWAAAPKRTWRVTDFAAEKLAQLSLMGAEEADLCGAVHDVAGYAHSVATSASTNFTVATVLNAGHLAPGNQPVSALDMVTRFIERRPF